MGFLNKILGFRWSLYIVKNEKQLVYAMHENNPMKIVGYVMGYFDHGAKPVEPWSLWLNFNYKHKVFELRSEHFTPDGEVSPALIREIESIDPGWNVKHGEPVFEEAMTKKRLNISQYNYRPGHFDAQAISQEIWDNLKKPPEVTFISVMDEVFGKC